MGEILNHMNIAPDALVPETPPTTVINGGQKTDLVRRPATDG